MDVSEYLNRAEKAIAQNEFKMAEQYYRQILNNFPQNNDALQGLKDLEVHKAKKTWSPVTRIAYSIWASLLTSFNKPEKAYPIFEILHRCNPSNKSTAIQFAHTAIKTGNKEEAHNAYQRILRLDPANVKILKSDADLLIDMERLQEAHTLYEQLHRLKPKDDGIAHTLRDISARSYAQVGIPEELTARRAAMEKEKREAPGSPEFVKRLETLQHLHRQKPDDVAAAVALAEHYRQGKHYKEANQILGPILDANPNNPLAQLEQARVWRSANELDIAVSLYEELCKSQPDERSLKDEYLEAKIAQLSHMASQNKDAVNQIETLRLEKDLNRIEILREIVTVNPDAHKEREVLGTLMLNRGKIDEAIPILQRLVHEPAWAGKGFFLLGQCFRALRDEALAVSQYEKSLEFFKNKGYAHAPNNDLKNVYYYMGIAKETLGDTKGAREAYGQVYSTDVNFKDIRKRYEGTFK